MSALLHDTVDVALSQPGFDASNANHLTLVCPSRSLLLSLVRGSLEFDLEPAVPEEVPVTTVSSSLVATGLQAPGGETAAGAIQVNSTTTSVSLPPTLFEQFLVQILLFQ
eukprot:GABW01002503.1.p1 GENE.GABW01002503.1~~GABW01002503.1.p1  ORF type:complete len:110 (-),score=12.21 GABW01002503.1:31-360(-)